MDSNVVLRGGQKVSKSQLSDSRFGLVCQNITYLQIDIFAHK